MYIVPNPEKRNKLPARNKGEINRRHIMVKDSDGDTYTIHATKGFTGSCISINEIEKKEREEKRRKLRLSWS